MFVIRALMQTEDMWKLLVNDMLQRHRLVNLPVLLELVTCLDDLDVQRPNVCTWHFPI